MPGLESLLSQHVTGFWLSRAAWRQPTLEGAPLKHRLQKAEDSWAQCLPPKGQMGNGLKRYHDLEPWRNLDTSFPQWFQFPHFEPCESLKIPAQLPVNSQHQFWCQEGSGEDVSKRAASSPQAPALPVVSSPSCLLRSCLKTSVVWDRVWEGANRRGIRFV